MKMLIRLFREEIACVPTLNNETKTPIIILQTLISNIYHFY